MLLAVSPVLPASAQTPLRSAVGRLEVPVASFKALREAGLVRQGWDISCGSAALSTILTYHYEDPYTEATIAVSMLKNTDPKRVRARGGFSLLDLKRFAEAVGYAARGYSGLTLSDLAGSPVPAIIPVRIRDYDHFVVFRGLAAGRVLLGDPAFGNLTMPVERFAEVWTSGLGFFVFADPGQSLDSEGKKGRTLLSPSALNLALPNLDRVQRLSRRAGALPPLRRRPGLP